MGYIGKTGPNECVYMCVHVCIRVQFDDGGNSGMEVVGGETFRAN